MFFYFRNFIGFFEHPRCGSATPQNPRIRSSGHNSFLRLGPYHTMPLCTATARAAGALGWALLLQVHAAMHARLPHLDRTKAHWASRPHAAPAPTTPRGIRWGPPRILIPLTTCHQPPRMRPCINFLHKAANGQQPPAVGRPVSTGPAKYGDKPRPRDRSQVIKLRAS